MSKDIVLYTQKTSVYCELSKDYLLYLAETEVIEKMDAAKIVMLVAQTIAEHQRQTVH